MKAILIALLGAAAAIAASTIGASAQVLNLSGQFQCVQGCVAAPLAPAFVTQADWQLNLVNEAGMPSRAGSIIRVISGRKPGTKARSIRRTA